MVQCEVRVNRLQMESKQYRRGDLVELPMTDVLRLGNSVRALPPVPADPIVDPVAVEDEPIPPDEPKKSRNRKTAV